MRLQSLEVENFRGLRQARLAFGPGLNVLYGPNDLGKSSLVEALRAALLLPVTSKAAQEYVPWATDSAPKVVVQFEVKGSQWRLSKTFGTKGTEFLERVDASGALLEEAQGRHVEGKLRVILEWGIPVPGGAGGARGVPESYLATALIGRQDQIMAILQAGLDKDGSQCGRDLITGALGALGQDPLVGTLRDRLEEEVGKAFTPTGQRRRTPDSPLFKCARRVEDQQKRLEEVKRWVERSEKIERELRSRAEEKTKK